jgi:methionyl-tRNA formyltransferase
MNFKNLNFINCKNVLITNNNLNSMLSLSSLIDKDSNIFSLIIITKSISPKENNFTTIIKLISKAGFKFVFYKLLTNLFIPFFLKILNQPVTVLEKIKKLNGNPTVIYTNNINEESVFIIIRKFNPDIILAAGAAHIIHDRIINLSKLFSINIHSSILPAYAGSSPYFWVLKNNENKTGATIHEMNDKVDSGDILLQKSIIIENHDSVLSLSQKISKLNNEILFNFFTNNFDKAKKQNLKLRSHFKSPSKKDIEDFVTNGKHFYTAKHVWKYIKHVKVFNTKLK